MLSVSLGAQKEWFYSFSFYMSCTFLHSGKFSSWQRNYASADILEGEIHLQAYSLDLCECLSDSL